MAAGEACPVEYKLGRAKEEAYLSDAVQLAAQALCLRESRGIKARRGFVYYHKSHTRREVVFTPELFRAVEAAVVRMRALLQSPRPPRVEVPPPSARGVAYGAPASPSCGGRGGGVGVVYVLENEAYLSKEGEPSRCPAGLGGRCSCKNPSSRWRRS